MRFTPDRNHNLSVAKLVDAGEQLHRDASHQPPADTCKSYRPLGPPFHKEASVL